LHQKDSSVEKLDLFEVRGSAGHGYAVAYFNGGEVGMSFGPETKDESDPEDHAIHNTLNAFANSLAYNNWFEYMGMYVFVSLKHAKKALSLAKFAKKNVELHVPEWAQEALIQGWKPPKGWRP